ncbi:hypothetical protein [Actinomadura rudentiformis]|uniref:DUF4288 domain-containing protein n=1 Tax=Actinomadura rudentiformis TaxID=359158 RepID=A0A6H9YUA4_9ACTN|nr:hypothetical protein [Actinomadura rudentiformis]KAB2352187.1 hypothetical protein F8566_00245 [Actinomadura rudentiformis]
MDRSGWYGVRCFFAVTAGSYEESITVWRADSFDEAIAKAEAGQDGTYLEMAQAFFIGDELGEGTEVFSLIRDSELEADDYLTRFFDTGRERQAS